MNLLRDLGSSQTQWEVWRAGFVNQEIPSSQEHGHKNFSERGCLGAAPQSPGNPARPSLLSPSLLPTLDTHCYCLNHFPTFPASLHLSLSHESRSSVFTSDWLNRGHLLVFLMPVGKEKECLMGTCPLSRLMQCLISLKKKGRLQTEGRRRQIGIFLYKFLPVFLLVTTYRLIPGI